MSAAGRTTLHGPYLFIELRSELGSAPISLERPWAEIGQAAQELMVRRCPGTAALRRSDRE